MLIQLSRRKSRKKRVARRLLVLCVLVFVFFAAPPAYKEAKESYRNYKSARALRQAKEFFAAKDVAKAATALQVAIRTDRQNPEIWKTIADMTESMGGREAIQQRQQVVMLSPGDNAAQIALAQTAMRFGDIFSARDALAAVPESFRDTTDYRRAVALFAIIEGNGSTADQVLASLMRSDSSDSLRLTHATVRMSHPDPVQAQSARQEIAGMVETPELATAALRELMRDAIRRKDFIAARTWADRLVKLPAVHFNDRLALATLLMANEKKTLDELMPPLTEQAKGNPESVADLVRWLLGQRQPERARELVDAQPDAIKSSFVVKAVRVELAATLKDWAGMGELIYQGALGPVPEGALRMALESRTVNELQGADARFVHWQKAIDLTRTNIFGLRVLYQLGVTWKWGREVEETLMVIAQGFSSQTWAHEALVRVYTVQANGPGLQKVFNIWSQQSPGVNRLKHDAALMDLLVTGQPSVARALVTAESLQQNEPSNPNYATTCALAYTLAGRSDEAVALVARMKQPDRRDPARAHYLAFIYAKAGQMDPAREQLALVRPASTLLKEEAALATQAKGLIDQFDQKSRELERLTRDQTIVPKSEAPSKAVQDAKP